MSNKNREVKIVNEKQYEDVMHRIDLLMKKGEGKVTKEESLEIRALALAAEAYEQSTYTVPMPKTLAGILEFVMYKNRLNQSQLAYRLGVSNTKFSQVLSGKQKPDVEFLKAVHTKLNIDGNQLLQAI